MQLEELMSILEGLTWRIAYGKTWSLLKRLMKPNFRGKPPRLEKTALYIHIPFCRFPCKFCCFVRFHERSWDVERYYKLVTREAVNVVSWSEARITHVHIGGGTPAIRVWLLAELVDVLREHAGRFTLTIELHPKDLVDDVGFEVLKSIRADRVSLGVQTYNDEMLKKIGRLSHDAKDAIVASKRASRLAETVNIDLLWEVEGQDLADVARDMLLAVELGANQLTLYPAFTYYRTRHPKAFSVYRAIVEVVRKLGWRFDTPWTFSSRLLTREYIVDEPAYLGIGLSSISHVDGMMYVNTFSLRKYEDLVEKGLWSARAYTRLTPTESRLYDAMYGVQKLLAEIANRSWFPGLTGLLYLAGEAQRAVYSALALYRRLVLSKNLL